MYWEIVAAWVQAIGSVVAIFAAGYFIRYEKRLDRQERDRENHARALGLAAELDMLLALMSAKLTFEPIEDTGAMTTAEAFSAMRLRDKQLEALRMATKDAFLFGSPTADELVLLGLEAAQYQAIVKTWAEKLDHDAQLFLERIRSSAQSLDSRVERVRALLRSFLPKEAERIPDPE